MTDHFGIAVAVVARTISAWTDDRIAQVEGHEGHVEGVAGHVAQRAGAEVPPAAPVEGMIGFVAVGPPGSAGQPEVPVQVFGRHRPDWGRSSALRPDRAGWSRRGPP